MLLGPIAAVGMGMIVSAVPVLVIEAVTPEEQATANGLQMMIQGLLITVITQLVYVALAQDSKVVQGTRFYVDSGYKTAMLLSAALAAVGLVTVFLVPKLRRAQDVEAQTAVAAS